RKAAWRHSQWRAFTLTTSHRFWMQTVSLCEQDITAPCRCTSILESLPAPVPASTCTTPMPKWMRWWTHCTRPEKYLREVSCECHLPGTCPRSWADPAQHGPAEPGGY